MKKKLLSLLLALCLVMALVPMTAFAEGTSVDNWDGTAVKLLKRRKNSDLFDSLLYLM